jgi:hypothetical protein
MGKRLWLYTLDLIRSTAAIHGMTFEIQNVSQMPSMSCDIQMLDM